MMEKRWGIALLSAVCLCGMVLPLPALAEGTAMENACATASKAVASLAKKCSLKAGTQRKFPMESLCYSSNGAVVRAQSVEDETYLFLPASADSACIVLNCDLEEGQLLYVSGDKQPEGIPAADGFALDAVTTPEQGKYRLKLTVCSQMADGTLVPVSEEKTLLVMQSANFSAVYLTSEEADKGQDYVNRSKKNAIKGSMTMLTAEGETVYEGKLTQIKARGNSTFLYYPKKSYQIKLKKKTALIEGSEPGKTWVLLGGYADALRLSDDLWKDVAEAGGLYTAKSERVDLYFDGAYCGSYELSEKNQLNKNRINLVDMEEAYEELNEDYGEDAKTGVVQNRYGNLCCYTKDLVDPEQMGGFLLELNDKTSTEASWFKTSRGYAVSVRSPEYASQNVMLYISEYFQAFEDAITATDAQGNHTGQNPDTGLYYYDYCDLESLVQQYMLNCLASNRDAFWYSLYFYMDTDGMLYAGPLWDMELTLGVGWNQPIPAQADFLAHTDNGGDWSEELIQIPSFRAALKEAYEETWQEILSALLGDPTAQEKTGLLSIRERAELGRASVAMDNILWPDRLMCGSPCALYPNQSYVEYYASGMKARFRFWPEETSYDQIVDTRIQWLQEHKEFLDGYFAAM